MFMKPIPAIAGLLALVGCAAPTPPDCAAEYQPAMDAYMAGWNEGNVDGLDAVITESFQRRAPGGMNANGLEAMKKVMTDLRAAYPDAHVALDDSQYMKDMS